MCERSSESSAREMAFLAAGRLSVRIVMRPVCGAGTERMLMSAGVGAVE